MILTPDITKFLEIIDTDPSTILYQFADACEEAGNIEIAKGLRWLAHWRRWPIQGSQVWTWSFVASSNFETQDRTAPYLQYYLPRDLLPPSQVWTISHESCSAALLWAAERLAKWVDKWFDGTIPPPYNPSSS